MPWFTLLIGAVLGGLLGGRFETAVAGGFIGLVVGLVLNASRKSRVAPAAAPHVADADPFSLIDPRVAERLRAMERRIATLEAMPRPAAPATVEAALPLEARPVETVPQASATREDERVAMDTLRTGNEAPAMPAYGAHRTVAGAESGATAATQPARDGAPTTTPFSTLWRGLTGGNTLARVGILVLFVGVAFLLKYATEHVLVPIELRIAAVALGGVALLLLGWRLRERRAGYAMILQGGGVGVLYLTVFAALRLYALVPAPAAFALLVAIAAFSGVLAVRQDAIGLAAVGIIGGFAAPILTSSQSGNHVMLFAYYALLNAGILGIAWFKAWRLLNVLGFACTFVIGTLWGVTRYRAGDFATTEPFLVLFFLFYVAIAVLYALRRSVSVRDYVDGTIVFGTPLVTAGLQQALVRPYEFGMAMSALAAAAAYLVLARVLWSRHRDELRLLSESFLALGVVCATLAVPLAFDAHWTSATWALEGAAIVWVGARQRRVLARGFGLVLQVAAGVAFALGAHRAPADALPILNSAFVGAALVALGGLVSALVYERRAADVGSDERRLVLVLAFAWGTLWWLFAGAQQIERFVASPRRPAMLVAFLTATAAGFALGARALAWPLARVPAMLLAPALLALALFHVGMGTVSGVHLFAAGGALAWPLAIAVGIASLRFFEREGACAPGSASAGALHGAWLWLVALVAADEIAWTAAQYTTGAAWRSVPWGLVPAVAIGLVCRLARGTAWPTGVHRRAYLTVGAAPLVAWMLVWSLVVGVASDGDPSPLPYLPLVNPVDLTLAFIAAALLAWVSALRRDRVDVGAQVPRPVLIGVVAAFAFLWINAVALRALHHAFDIDWSLGALWDATIVQATLSLLWSVIALAAMVVANRAGARDGWIAGAVLLSVVVVKLFAVDLSRIGSVERIVSFIGVGLLLLAIGYLAPVPARKEHAP
jgi:uncharacterized membrane protein